MMTCSDQWLMWRNFETAILGAALIGLVGCQEPIGDQREEEVADVKKGTVLDRSAIADRMRVIGIRVDTDLYMIPTGQDEAGCETFNPFSTENFVKTAVHYRQADGSFDIARDPAVCKVKMVAIGPDGEGCERYRAEPVNKDHPIDQEVVYYKRRDGSYATHKPGGSCRPPLMHQFFPAQP